MTEEKLTRTDRKRIFVNLKNSYLAGFGFLLAVLIFMAITHSGFALFGLNHHANWLKRIVSVFSVFFFVACLVAISYYNSYLDLINGKKVVLNINRYKIVNLKRSVYLVTDIPNYRRIELDEEQLPFINRKQPLRLELAKRSWLILFISNGTDNYLDKPAVAA
jgi:predicted PurR-regulated permease PerM